MAGWVCDFQDGPVHRRIIDEPIAIFNDDKGLVALHDVCPHRFSALSSGQVIDGAIECPYHGLRFDRTGGCAFNPHSDRTPDAVRVKTYPLAQRNEILWIWMGDPALADEAKIVEFPMAEPVEGFTHSTPQTLEMDINYELIVDNLMDLSHVQFTHATSLGSDKLVPGEYHVEDEGEAIWSKRMGRNGSAPPWAAASGACNADDRVDYRLNIRWTKPASFDLYASVVEAGELVEQSRQLSSVQILTPQSEGRTYYFIRHYRNYEMDNHELSDILADTIADAFKNEDEPTVSAAADRMRGQEFWSLKPILLPCDAGAIRVRRRREELLQQEAGNTAGTDQVAKAGKVSANA